MSSRPFAERHIGPSPTQQSSMLSELGLHSFDELANKTVPQSIRLQKPLNIPESISENAYLTELKALASENRVLKSSIGMGYYGCYMPPVIQRNILENPGWYTAYTPYQAEISQGRLEMLFHFQTMISELSGLPISGASLLDEATAAAEAMAMFHAQRKGERQDASIFALVGEIFPQTAAVIRTRAKWLGIEIREWIDIESMPTSIPGLYGALLQNPDGNGTVRDLTENIHRLQLAGIQVVIACDLLASALVKSAGAMGADAAIGSTQRFGLPLGNGGPHAGWLSCIEGYKRLLPGRIIGLSKDSHGKPAYRMALGTREQHIRREKATSNICTAQVLPAVLATAFALYHGPQGLHVIAKRVHNLTNRLAAALAHAGVTVQNACFFDTIKAAATPAVFAAAVALGYNLRRFEDGDAGISLDETTEIIDIINIASLWNAKVSAVEPEESPLFLQLIRQNIDYLHYAVFLENQSEHALLRYLKKLENKDISLTHSMIPLGSCTMKLNAAAEMIPLSWPELANIHPFAPSDQKNGYGKIIQSLEQWLAEITQFSAVSLMPNSGAQGEYAGLVTIRAYQEAQGQSHRNIALIPSSAHGTNPASAALAGLTCVTVKCDEKGNIDIDDLRVQAETYKDRVAVLMVTYPSTHGVFEESITEVCAIVHGIGAQVYMDGANMNAQVGLTAPGIIGADVCHLNLHKTFAIPHGGGGPGAGPIGVAQHLKPFLPKHPVTDGSGQGAVSASPWGSALILAISYGYIRMMGGDGLRHATLNAILNANYLRLKLSQHYPILYTGVHGFCAHEFIVDCRGFKKATGIEAGDIAKRLMDYGFHAPTVSFPVANTLMIEPTESEPLEELNRFAEAMIQIRKEISAIEDGTADKEDNMLHHAPHTLDELLGEWKHAYSREEAAFPLNFLRNGKPWPSVSRIDNAFGDRNLICTCAQVGE